MYLPRRPSASMSIPATASTNISGSGCRTIVGKASSARSMVRPTRCGRRSLTIVSTSGSSGTSGANDRELFHIGPVGACFRLDLDPGLELVCAGHDARHLLRKLVELRFRHLEEELVMNLQQHAALDLVGLDLAGESHHRDLDDVGGQRLHREVDRHALGGAPQLKVWRTQVGDRASPACRAHDETFLARL